MDEGQALNEVIQIKHPRSGKLINATDFVVDNFSENDESGEPVVRKIVRFTVIGKHRRWGLWAYYDVFKKQNACVNI